MLSKGGKFPLKITLSLLVVFSFVIFFSYSKERIREEIYLVIDGFPWSDFGVSGLPGLYGRSNMTEFGDSWAQIGTTLFLESGKNILSKIPGMASFWFASNDLPNIKIDIKFKHLSSLRKDREEALAKGILLSKTKVPFDGLFNGQKIKGKLRIKGDLNDHWRSEKRMSLKVDLDSKSALVLGMKSFYIQKPESRAFPHDALFQELTHSLGILSTRHKFSNVTFNGLDWGVMDIQESFSKELIEKGKRKDSIILKLDNESVNWRLGSFIDRTTKGYLGYSHLISSINKKNKYLESNSNQLLLSNTLFDIETKSYSLLDNPKLARLALSALIWGDIHVLMDSNVRYYINPYTNLLEPISSDQSHFRLRVDNYETVMMPNFFYHALNETKRNGLLLNYLNEIQNAIINLQKKYDSLKSIFPNDSHPDFEILFSNFKVLKTSIENDFNIKLYDPYLQFTRLEKKLTPFEWAEYVEDFVVVNLRDDGKVTVKNLMPEDIVIHEIFYNGKRFLDGEVQLAASSKNDVSIFEFKLNQDIYKEEKVYIETSLGGLNKVTENQYLLPNPKLFLNSTTNKKHHRFRDDIFISEPTHLRGTVIIDPGTKFTFAEGASLSIEGTLIAKGSITNPIIFSANDKSWGGFYVLCKNNSEAFQVDIENVLFEKARNFSRDSINLTGAFNIYNCKSKISKSIFKNNYSEDALNIVASQAELDQLQFVLTPSDALDVDHSQIVISNISLTDIGGDAIDISGTNLNMTDATIQNVQDKAISIGEDSLATLKNLKIKEIGTGVAVKDGSKCEVQNVSIKNSKVAALMTYKKKSFYSSPSLEVNDLTPNNANIIRQYGSFLKVDGHEFPETNIDVEELYSTVMKK